MLPAILRQGALRGKTMPGGFMKQDEVLACNVTEAARRLGVSPRTVATLIARKELPSRKIGRRRVIPVRALQEFLRRDHRMLRVETEHSNG